MKTPLYTLKSDTMYPPEPLLTFKDLNGTMKDLRETINDMYRRSKKSMSASKKTDNCNPPIPVLLLASQKNLCEEDIPCLKSYIKDIHLIESWVSRYRSQANNISYGPDKIAYKKIANSLDCLFKKLNNASGKTKRKTREKMKKIKSIKSIKSKKSKKMKKRK